MTRLAYAPLSVKSDFTSYYGFRGIDRSRDITALETEKDQTSGSWKTVLWTIAGS